MLHTIYDICIFYYFQELRAQLETCLTEGTPLAIMDTDVDAMAEDPRFHCLLRERMKFMKAKSPFKMMVRIFVFTPSCHPQSRSICLYTKRSSKSRKPSEIAHTDSHAHKNKESVYSLTCYTCVLMSLPGDSEQSITGQRIRHCWCVRVL